MSRSGYTDDCENLNLWRGAVDQAIFGKRGQVLLREMLVALDVMPQKRLIKHELENNGEYCALGVVGKARGIQMDDIDPDEPDEIASMFNIARALACEVAYMNDEQRVSETPEERWTRMRRWVVENIAPT